MAKNKFNRISSIFLFFIVAGVFFGFADNSFAQGGNVCSGKVVPVSSLFGSGGGVLFKPENLHGGRGPSFLVQNPAERTNKQVIEIRNARCEPIASLGLFKTDSPYGSRYYSRSGGSGQSSNELLALAKQAGSNNILIEGVNGKWIRVKNPTQRDGSVRK